MPRASSRRGSSLTFGNIMTLTVEIAFWLLALCVFSAAPAMLLASCRLSERCGIAITTEKEVRRQFRWIWKVALGIAAVPLLTAAIMKESLFESMIVAALFSILSYRLRANAHFTTKET